MPEHDLDLTALLREVRDIGVTPPDARRLRAAVVAAIEQEEAGAGRRRGLWRRLGLGGARLLMPATGVAVALAVGILALVGLGSRSGMEPAGAQAQGLLDRLSVLRRPQTPADRLPSPLHLRSAAGNGQIIPDLTRLVATLPGARVYLVVTRPPSGEAPPNWSPRFGDLASILTVTSTVAFETPGQPAIDLTDGLEIRNVMKGLDRPGRVRLRAGQRSASLPGARLLYRIGIVPDGVARVAWRFRVIRLVRGFAEPTARTVIVHPHIVGNIAYAPGTRQSEQLTGADWYAANGSRIPTSDSALRHALIHRQQIIRLQALDQVEHNTYHANPQLLRSFAVFAVRSATGVLLADGVTISKPPIKSLPFGILNWLEPNDTVTEPDPEAVRLISMPSGIQFYVIAGARGLCVAEIDRGVNLARNPAFAGLGGGGGEGCSGDIAHALQHGVGLTSSTPAGSTTYTVLPIAHPYMTIGRRGSRHTFAPPDGVYAIRSPISAR
jgi:hypothetical protein